jgi:hypothetical protein
MKKALLAGVAALFLATPAQAQRCAAGQGQAMAGKRGDTSAAGFDALGHTRDFVSMNSEAHRACGVR